MATVQLTADLRLLGDGRIQAQLVERPEVIASAPVHDLLVPALAAALAAHLTSDAPSPLPRTETMRSASRSSCA